MAEMDSQPKHREDGKRSEGKGQGRKNQRQNQRFKMMHEKRNPDAIPILKFGPSNNFMKFKEALSKKALEEYGALGKLIKKGEIEEPIEPYRTEYDIKDEFDRVAYLEDMKQYRQDKAEIKRDKPKLYALILKYLSDESLEAVQQGEGWLEL